MTDEIVREYLHELKRQEPSGGHHELSVDGEECRVRILGRGETAFYQQGDRALLVEVLAGRGVIFAASIRRWDDGGKVTQDERRTIVEVLKRAMGGLDHDRIIVEGD